MTVPIPNDYDLKGVAVLCFDPQGEIIMVIEPYGKDRPDVGKFAGMASIPMGAIKEGESAETAAIREFGEETGLGIGLLYPIGFFEIVEPDRRRCGVWAFFGRLTGHPYKGETERTKMFTLSERDFLGVDTFHIRPLNREIYTAWKWLKLALDVGKPLGWVRDMVKSHAPAKVRQWLSRE
ncbi:NUDIX domain-containing protein [Patescibacteria group bacterium]|nr:NUDIX domain-containing protein [Patescibacteria group bacterium]